MTKAGFKTPLDLRAYEPGEWVLLRALTYRSKDGVAHVVPTGFVTDLASIPRLLRWVIDTNGPSRPAAVLHDHCYCVQTKTRAQSDEIFLEALEVSGVGWIQRQAMYAAVRAGGWIYWNKRSKNKSDPSYDFVPDSYWD